MHSAPLTNSFGPHEEAGIISLILDFPETYVAAARFLVPEIFTRPECKMVIASIAQDYEKHQIVPSRALLKDKLARSLTVEDAYEDVLGVVTRPSNPREIPILRETFLTWIKHRSYELLYSEEAMQAYERKDYDAIDKIVENAQRIGSLHQPAFWFFNQLDELFQVQNIDHIGTGFPNLDKVLNMGGPSRKEVVVFMAPTGVGKTLMLVANAVAALKQGLNVMFVTFELSTLKTAARIAGAMSHTALHHFMPVEGLNPTQHSAIEKTQRDVQQKIKGFSHKYKSKLAIYELAPDECSVNEIYSLIQSERRLKDWHPDVVILDYLELMRSRRTHNNKDDYTRQKSVATEIRGLAKNENVLVYTATQGNRSSLGKPGNGAGTGEQRDGRPTPPPESGMGLDKMAESYAKAMPTDYVVSLNQTEDEYRQYNPDKKTPGIIRLWVAKNRNGPRFISVETHVFYEQMLVREPDNRV